MGTGHGGRMSPGSAMATTTVKLVNAALDEIEGGTIILRGVIDPESLNNLKVADYQREILPTSCINELVDALEKSTVPDVELGMRGQRFKELKDGIVLTDDVYIIDGLQRTTAAKVMMQRRLDAKPRLGAMVHFSTTEEWERKRFDILNAKRTRLSSNVLVRNMRHDYPAIEMLYQMCCNDHNFVLRERVTWAQRMQRGQLLTAMEFLKTVGSLHSSFGPGKYSQADAMAKGLDGIMKNVGQNVLRDNVRAFFSLLDQCWGIKTVTFREGATHLKGTFLKTLAILFARHTHVFWKDKRFVIEKDMQRKLSSFPVMDPAVVNLASAGGKARNMMYQLMLDHLNAGKRTKRLTESIVDLNGDDGGDEDEEA